MRARYARCTIARTRYSAPPPGGEEAAAASFAEEEKDAELAVVSEAGGGGSLHAHQPIKPSSSSNGTLASPAPAPTARNIDGSKFVFVSTS